MTDNNLFITILFFILLAIAAIFCVVIAYFIISFLYIIITSFFISKKKEYSKPSKFWYKNYLFACKTICRLSRVKIHCSGLEKVPLNKHFLLVSNHRSKYDNMVQGIVLKNEHISYISKSENFKIPVAGKYVYRNMFLSIERGNLKEGAKTILKAINYLKNDYFSIGVFPEGKRSKNGQLLAFKPGCLKIAEKSKCPILVTSITGTEKVHKNFPFRKSHVYFDVIEVLMPEDYAELNTIEIAEKLHSIIKNNINKKCINSN